MADRRPGDDVVSDLVAYLLVVVPDVASLADLGPSLVDLAESATVRLLDLVVITRGLDGGLEILELGDVGELAGLEAASDGIGGLLTERDIELISLALQPATTGLVLVTEDRWARSLSAAARRVGGHIVAGERIPAARIEAVVAGPADPSPGG